MGRRNHPASVDYGGAAGVHFELVEVDTGHPGPGVGHGLDTADNVNKWCRLECWRRQQTARRQRQVASLAAFPTHPWDVRLNAGNAARAWIQKGNADILVLVTVIKILACCVSSSVSVLLSSTL